MSVISIVRPMQIASIASGSGSGWQNAAAARTVNPKEAAIYPSGGNDYLAVDLGSERQIDQVFIGYTNDSSIGSLRIQVFNQAGATMIDQGVGAAPGDGVSPQHFLLDLPGAAVAARSLRILSTTSFPAGYTIGVVATGLAIRPFRGHEFGSGRSITDTSTITRLIGGGFAIDEGAIVGGYQWTLGDLNDDELRQLWAIARSLGASRTALVTENPDFTPGLNERIHWGLMKFDVYERFAPGANRYPLSIADWG